MAKKTRAKFNSNWPNRTYRERGSTRREPLDCKPAGRSVRPA